MASADRITLRTLRDRAARGERFAVLTCYDATTARWLWRAGVGTLLVGDTAAEVILGHDSTLPVSVELLLELTAAVRRGAPDAFVLGDMPFGSYQCGDDAAVANAARFMTDGGADAVKLEVEAADAPLVERMSRAGIPVVAHIGARPQRVRAEGGYRRVGGTEAEADRLVADARALVEAGASMLLLEAVSADATRRVRETARAEAAQELPVIGCGAGDVCDGDVVVLHDLLGLTDWQPPFARPIDEIGPRIRDAAAAWRERVEGRQSR